MELMWDFNAANLRLAGEVLSRMREDARHGMCDRLEAESNATEGIECFVRFHQSLAKIAGCPMIDTLARCVVAYQSRMDSVLTDRELPAIGPILREIIVALRRKDIDGAERQLRDTQDEVEAQTLRHFAICIAAE
jgi:DNA-binding GntR family transcriptional regulator